MIGLRMTKEILEEKLRIKHIRDAEEIKFKEIETKSDRNKIDRLQVRVTKDEMNYIEGLANLRGMTRSDYIRFLIQKDSDELLSIK